jgi:integrase
MAKKTNYEKGGNKYYRIVRTIGKRPDGKPDRKEFLGSCKREAEEKYATWLKGYTGSIKNYDKMTFIEIFDKWFHVILKPSIADSSFNRYDSIWRLWIKESNFSNLPLIKVTGLHIQEHINTIPSKHTGKSALNLIKQFFKYCMICRYIQFDPTLGTTPPKIVTKDKKHCLTSNEAKVVIEAMKDDPTLFPYVFTMFTGLRQGEMLALKHADVDLINGMIKVTKSLNRTSVKGKSQIVVGPPKNLSSIRDIPILLTLKPYIKAHVASEKEKHLACGQTFTRESYFFTQRNLSPLRGDRLTSRWRDVQGRLGMDPILFHDLRHTFCTFLAKENVPLVVAAKLMGHSDIETTAKIYTHVDNDDKEKAISKLAYLL